MGIKLLIILLFSSFFIYGQNEQFLEGEIIKRNGDTLEVKIKMLNRFKSFNRIIYLNDKGIEKRMPVDSIRAYRRGNEIYENLILNSEVFVLAKKVIQGPEMSLYIWDERETLEKRIFNEAIGKKMPKVFQHKYLKDKNNNVLNVTNPFKRKVKRFLTNYPEVVAKIENKELTKVEEIVVECNNGSY
ncbi:hypothetical protein [Allomuricauda sp. R78024]|uniref:hypothetical protein n=1 Tax=Allomuricauda sp. R78024 TaxID=3093867 RepID=UPI0037C97C39